MDQRRADLKKLIEINAHDSIYLADIFISSTNIITLEPLTVNNIGGRIILVRGCKSNPFNIVPARCLVADVYFKLWKVVCVFRNSYFFYSQQVAVVPPILQISIWYLILSLSLVERKLQLYRYYSFLFYSFIHSQHLLWSSGKGQARIGKGWSFNGP